MSHNHELLLRVALLGFGTVGGSVARILVERPELADRVQLTHVFNRGVARKRADWVPAPVTWTEDVDEVFAAKPDALVEVVGGVEPAGTWVRRALDQRIAVVTANKGLNEPRYASLKGIMMAKKKPLEVLDAAGLGLDATKVGAGASGARVARLEPPAERSAGRVVQGDAADAVGQLVKFLKDEVKAL